MPAPLDLAGRPFGRLVARQVASGPGRRAWLCDCSCGRRKVVTTDKLMGGIVTSCGCREAENRQAIKGPHPASDRDYHCPGCGRILAGHPNRKYCSLRCKARCRRGWERDRFCRFCGDAYRLTDGQTTKRLYCSSACETRAASVIAVRRRDGTLEDQAAALGAAIKGK